MIKLMLPGWLNAREAVKAGWQLADSFPPAAAGDAVREFLCRAAREAQVRKLNFYKRVRFASAFKWRLLENGIEAATARDLTQSLLLQVLMPSSPEIRDTPAQGRAITKRQNRKHREDLSREGAAALARGDFAAALTLYQESVAANPRDAGALNHLGIVLSRLGRYDEADRQFRASISRRPNDPDPHINLGGVLLPRGRYQEAEGCFRRALSLRPTDLAARSNLGMTLVLIGRPDSARNELEKVLRIAPRHADSLFGMGMLARSEGKFDAAEEMFQRALAANPEMSRAWAALAGVRKMTAADSAWLKRAEQVAMSLKTAHEQAEVRYAIGKYFDDLGKHSQAFESYRQANELLKSIAPPYNAEVHTRFVDGMIRLYTPERISQASEGASQSSTPIFVVGMPRSGTSLVEQILASHPAVGGAGELPFWNDLVWKRDAQVRRELLSPRLRQQIAADYLRMLRYHCPESSHVVDKNPVNSEFLGIIHAVFPQARIIYLQRDPVDTGLSCYFQHFPLALNWTLDLSDITRYYGEHTRLFQHWRAVLPPGSILEVPYEELVSNPEAWTRSILQFVGLDWDERCLQFHKTARTVVTASYWQVRQSVYRDSVQRWRKYSKFIGPLRDLQTR